MKLITTDIVIEAVVRFMKRNYHKFSRLEILFVELYKEHVIIVASVKHSREDNLKYYVFEYVMCQCTELPVNLLQFAIANNNVLQYHTIGFSTKEDAMETAGQIMQKLKEE